VVAAGDSGGESSREALATLFAAYWFPVYAYIRRRGYGPDEALDLTQSYFARLLEKGVLASADPARGRFRAFLRTDCAFFLADRRDHDRAAKRGGGLRPLSIDARDAEGRYLAEPSHGETPERVFERAWARGVVESAARAVADHYASTGRAPLFDALRPHLMADPDAAPLGALSARLGLSAGAARVALHRLRARFAHELRRQVAGTLATDDPAAVDDELRELLTSLG
jgi:RNA polymerase sigma-70 factor (ECF subfamily)